mgnify:CR=1 FL=1
MSILSLRSVSKSFGALKVTDDVSFDLQPGEALGIIGPNGAGKSTLFNLITGNIAPDTGRITFLGQDVTRRPAMDRVRMGVGRSFQIPQPFEGLTTFENLLTAAAYGQNKREAEVADECVAILQDTELLPKANQLAGTLSLLDRKRLELAMVLVILALLGGSLLVPVTSRLEARDRNATLERLRPHIDALHATFRDIRPGDRYALDVRFDVDDGSPDPGA